MAKVEKNILSRKKGVVIRQSNDIIEARYNFTLWEMRIFKTMLSRISASDETFKEETLSIRDLLTKYEMSDGGKIYDLVKEAATNVKSRFVYVPYFDERSLRRLKIMPLFASIDVPLEYADGSGYIKLQFNDVLKPYLIQLQSRYTSIDEEILAKMDSAYTMRIYELVKENEFKTFGEFTLQDFREIIGAIEYNERQEVVRDVMKNWQDIKRAILKPSQDHINKYTDITFKFDKILAEKSGPGRRKVAGVRFYDIKSKQSPEENNSSKIVAPKKFTVELKELLALIADFGITQQTVQNWLEKYGKQQVYNAIAYSLEKNKAGKIKDMAAYIYKMVQTPEIINPAVEAEVQTKKQQKKKQEAQTQLEFQKSIEDKVGKIKADFYRVKKNMVIKLIEVEEKLHNELLTSLKIAAQNSRNPITLMAFNSYKTDPKLDAKEEFLQNFENNSNFAGYVVSQIEKIRTDVYQKTLINYRKKVIAAGFDENIIS